MTIFDKNKREQIISSQEDSNVFFEAVLNPKEPNNELSKSANEFKIKANGLDSLSKEYINMMDGLLERFENNKIEFSSIEDVQKRKGIPNKETIEAINEALNSEELNSINDLDTFLKNL